MWVQGNISRRASNILSTLKSKAALSWVLARFTSLSVAFYTMQGMRHGTRQQETEQACIISQGSYARG